MDNTKVSILFGENEVKEYEETKSLDKVRDNISSYSFNTKEEREAFQFGIQTAIGWQDFMIIDSQ